MTDVLESKLTEKQQAWLGHIRNLETSGLSAPVYCQQQGLSLAGLYNARLILRRKGLLPTADSDSTSPFVPVTVVDRSTLSLPACRVVTPCGLTLEFTEALTMVQIQTLLSMEIRTA